MSDLLSDNPQERNDAVKRILNTAQSNLVKKIREMTEIPIEQSKIQIIPSNSKKRRLKKYLKNLLN